MATSFSTQDRTIANQIFGGGRAANVRLQRFVGAKGRDAAVRLLGAARTPFDEVELDRRLGLSTANTAAFQASGGATLAQIEEENRAKQLAQQRETDRAHGVGGPFEGLGLDPAVITRFNSLLDAGRFTQENAVEEVRGLIGSGTVPIHQFSKIADLDFGSLRDAAATRYREPRAVAEAASSGVEQNDRLAELSKQIADLTAANTGLSDRISNIATSDTTSRLPSPPATGNVGIRTEDSKAIESLSEQVSQLVADQKEGYSNEDIRREQQRLVAGLGSDAETAGRSALEQLRVPAFTRSPLEGALESRFLDDLADPTQRDVGIGSVGGLLQEQLLARLGAPFEEDAIRQAARQRFSTDAAGARGNLVAELSRLGVLRGGGNTIDSLGRFDAGIQQGLLDIDAETQRRRDEDLARAQDFTGFEADLGLENRLLNERALDLALGFEQSQSDRTQRQREFEFGANEARLNMQQSVADRTLARLLTQTEPTQREQFEEGVRQAQISENLAQGSASLAELEAGRRYRLDQAEQNNQLALAKRALGLQRDELGQSALQIANQQAQFEAAQAQQAGQFTSANALQNRQFDKELAQQLLMFQGQQGQQALQFGRTATLAELQEANRAAQFGSSLEEEQAARAQQALQFGRSANLADLQTANQAEQFARELTVRQEQAAAERALQGLQLSQQDRQFLQAQQQAFGLSTRDLDMRSTAQALQNRQFDANLAQQLSMFQGQQGQQAAQFGVTAGQQDTALAQALMQIQNQNRQQIQAQQQQNRQFDLSLGEQIRQFNAAQGQQASQFGRQAEFQDMQLAQQATQFDRDLRVMQEQNAAQRALQGLQLSQQDKQFLQSQQQAFGLATRDLDMRSAAQALQNDQFTRQLGLQRYLEQENRNLNRDQMLAQMFGTGTATFGGEGQQTLQERQFAEDLLNSRFNRDVATAGLTGTFDGENTLQQRLAMAELLGELPGGQRTITGQQLDFNRNQSQVDQLLALMGMEIAAGDANNRGISATVRPLIEDLLFNIRRPAQNLNALPTGTATSTDIEAQRHQRALELEEIARVNRRRQAEERGI